MSLENAILELAKSITFHAEVLREVNQPINIQQEAKSEVSFEAPKAPKKSKKYERTEEVVAGNVVVSVDPAAPEGDQTAMRYCEPVKAKVEATEEVVAAKPETSTFVMEDPNPYPTNVPHLIDTNVPYTYDIVTSEMCKNLAKEKMAAGVDRNKIKGLVIEMGAESIADLTERNLVEFYNKLKSLK